jgi:hypothetical protein
MELSYFFQLAFNRDSKEFEDRANGIKLFFSVRAPSEHCFYRGEFYSPSYLFQQRRPGEWNSRLHKQNLPPQVEEKNRAHGIK